MKKHLLTSLLLSLLITVQASISFDTQKNITQVRIAKQQGENYIIANSYEGTIMAFSYSGTKMWSNPLSGYMNHDVWAADITNDGNSEILAANADGHIYCLSSSGDLLWSFKHSDAPMNAVTAVTKGATTYVVCGGYDLSIFYLDALGNLVKEVPSADFSIDKPWGDGVIPTKFRSSTNFLRPLNRADGTQKLAMIGTCNSMQTKGSIYVFEPLSNTAEAAITSQTKAAVGHMRTADVDGDGNDEIIMGSSSMIDQANVVIYNHNDQSQSSLDMKPLPSMDDFGYRVVQPVLINNGTSNQILTMYGSRCVVSDADLNNPTVFVNDYSYNDVFYDADNNKLLLASAQSGGSMVHIFDATDSNWITEYMNLSAQGSLAELLNNTESYRNALKSFTKPSWESDPTQVYWTNNDPDGYAKEVMNDVKSYSNTPMFLDYYWATKIQDPSDWGRESLENVVYRDKRDTRKNYSWSQSEVLNKFGDHLNNEGMATWGGHGNDPLYYSTETLKKGIDLANGKKIVYVFPELEAHNSDFDWCLNYHFYPLAEYGQGKNTTIFVRTKNIFWQSTAHMSLWSRMKSGEFADVFVPGMEETSDKMMDVSIPGRLGYWLSGSVDSWGTRTARDNTSFDRLRQHSHQMVPNHFLRQYVYNAALGAQYFNNFGYNMDYMSFIWELIAKGALYVPQRNELLNLSPVHLSMIDVDEHYLNEGTNIKWTTFFDQATEDANPMVWSRMNGSWPGAPVTNWDYSRYASGIKDRRVNFLPPNPNGIVMITPTQNGPLADAGAPRGLLDDNLHPLYKNNMKEYYTDGRNYYSEDGTTSYGANTYYETIEAEIENAAQYLPISVEGDVAWVLAQTAPKHLRLTLVDGAYINPSNKTATITFNTIEALNVIDVVDGSTFTTSGNTVQIDVPCGLFRFIDIEIAEEIDTDIEIPDVETSVNQSTEARIQIYPNPSTTQFTFTNAQLIKNATLFDVSGRVIKQINDVSSAVNIVNLKLGLYLIKGQTINGKSFNLSLIKRN